MTMPTHDVIREVFGVRVSDVIAFRDLHRDDLALLNTFVKNKVFYERAMQSGEEQLYCSRRRM